MSDEAKVLLVQRLIAVPFLVLGAWCLALPHSVESLTLREPYRHLSPTTALLIGCFGAQAMLAGMFITFSRFTRWTFLAYGLALLPFLWFNYHFVLVVPMFNAWLAIDLVANFAMLALCALGWRLSSRVDRSLGRA